MSWLLYLLIGAFAGVLAGLFGVGGGAIIVPILIFIFTLQGFAAESLVHLAVGTSFATIVITSCSSIVAHHKLGNVNWSIFKSMLPGLALGVIACSVVAAGIEGGHLQLAIASFLMLVSIQMFFGLQSSTGIALPHPAVLAAGGGVIGGASAFFGIGGGSLTVPFLSLCRQPMKKAVATSAACGLPIALFGAATYAVQGYSLDTLPAASTGYIYWPAFVGIALASMPCARLGARLASRLPESTLKKSFALLLFLIAAQMFFNR